MSISNPAALGRFLIDIDNRTVPINEQGQIDGIDPRHQGDVARQLRRLERVPPRPLSTLTVRYTHKRLRHGIEDIGLLDADGERAVYVIGNPGFGDASDSGAYGGVTSLGQHLTPKAQRDYDAVEARVTGRMAHFFYNASYTY